ncbi:MAG: ABC transporter ATP-binding protein [Sinimarinibacterium sp.]|jgi:ABC-type glutathione transport system ATPase component
MAPLLQVRELSVAFGGVTAVAGVSFELAPATALGIVGESGSGKSQTARAILGLSPPDARVSGRIVFDGQDLGALTESARNRWRGQQVGTVFQNPYASLTPHLRIGRQIGEVLELHRGLSRADAAAESRRLLDAVRIADAPRRLRQYPHELSGGMCQRVAIAMALACRPRLLLADEPTTALDVTTQAQLLDLLRELRRERGLALLLISHDLGVVAELCDEVLVMRRGRTVEHGALGQVLNAPQQPYTRALLTAAESSSD